MAIFVALFFFSIVGRIPNVLGAANISLEPKVSTTPESNITQDSTMTQKSGALNLEDEDPESALTKHDPAALAEKARLLFDNGNFVESLEHYEQLYLINPSPQLTEFIEKLKDYIGTRETATEPSLESTSPALDSVSPEIDSASPVLDSASPALDSVSPELDSTSPATESTLPQDVQNAPIREASSKHKSLGLTMGLSFFPGAGHFYLARPAKGGTIAVVTTGLYMVSFLTASKSKKKLDEYKNLGPETTQSTFDKFYSDYDRLRRKANTILILAAAAHLVGIIDVYWEHKFISLEIESEDQSIALAGRMRF